MANDTRILSRPDAEQVSPADPDRRDALRWLAGTLSACGIVASGACGPSPVGDRTGAPGGDAGSSSDGTWGGDDATSSGDSAIAGDADPGRVRDRLDAGEDPDAGVCEPTGADALGPFHADGAPFRQVLADPDEPGERVIISGVVRSEDCVTTLRDAIVDVWHADASGAYHDAGQSYRLRGQMRSDAQGRYSFESVLPGHYAGRPRHYHYIVSHPDHWPLTTQLYFSGDPYLGPNDSCQQPTCDSDDPDRIIALRQDTEAGRTVLRGTFDLQLQRR